MRVRARMAAAATVTAVLAAFTPAAPAVAAPGPAPAPGARQVLAGGHADLVTVLLEGGGLVVTGKTDAGRFDPGATTLHVTDAARRPAPSSPAYGFLGVPGGSPIHVIPQAFRPDVLWAGWNTEAVPRGALAGDAVDLALRSARGPGRVEVYLFGADGPERVFSSHDSAVRTTRVAVPTHAHANWVFTAPGVYELEFQATATAASGVPLSSPPTRYVIAVGPRTAEPTATTLRVDGTGTGVELASAVTGGPEHLDGGVPRGWVEFVRHTPAGDRVAGHVALTDGSGTLSLPEDAEALAFTARFVPAVGDLVAGSRSPAVANPAAPPGAVVTGVRDRYAPGETIAATALVSPERPDHTVSWWTRSNGTTTARDGDRTLGLTASGDLDGAELGFDLRDPRGEVVGSARPVALSVTAVQPTTPPSPKPTGTTPAPVAPTSTVPAPRAAPAETAAAETCVPTAVTRPAEPREVEVVTDGHFDYGPVVEGGALSARVKDDRQGAPVHRDPGGYVFHLDDTARATPPAGSGLDFLGSGPVWMVPLTQRSGIPWLGWNTQHPSVLSGVSGDVTMTLENVEGPGELAVYGQDPFGGVGERYFGTATGFPRSTIIPVGQSGVHVHAVWAFTEPGAYAVTFSFGASVGGRQTSAKSTLAFHVGPGEPRAAPTGPPVVEQVGRTSDGRECALPGGGGGLASTGLDGPVVAGLVVAAVLLIPLGFLLTSAATLAAARRGR